METSIDNYFDKYIYRQLCSQMNRYHYKFCSYIADILIKNIYVCIDAENEKKYRFGRR